MEKFNVDLTKNKALAVIASYNYRYSLTVDFCVYDKKSINNVFAFIKVIYEKTGTGHELESIGWELRKGITDSLADRIERTIADLQEESVSDLEKMAVMTADEFLAKGNISMALKYNRLLCKDPQIIMARNLEDLVCQELNNGDHLEDMYPEACIDTLDKVQIKMRRHAMMLDKVFENLKDRIAAGAKTRLESISL